MPAAWVAAAGGLIGALGGGSAGSASTSTQNTIAPQLAPYIYGQSGVGGLLGNVNSIYAQQNAQGGLNPMQNAGLEMQRQALMNPAYTQGYGLMRNAGAGLLGAGIAGNPFLGGGPAVAQVPGANHNVMPPPMMQAGGSGGFPQAATETPTNGGAQNWQPSVGNPSQAGNGPFGGVSNGPSAPAPSGGGLLGAANSPIQQQTQAGGPAGLTQADLEALIAQQKAANNQPAPPVTQYSSLGT